ncbi:DUF2750 domain-containing protein [Aquirhabdus sp.]|uniref:DUF2750 domain-containing protein n=1 Tax=Aquirhabdus sp. TaxID=2824160 RepID=UPI00396CA71D
MKINQKQIDAVLALPSTKRYEHFIKVVADGQEVWGLYCDGWALSVTEAGGKVFPMWPAQEYASLCAEKTWSGYMPKSFSIDDLMSDLLLRLKKDGVALGIFYTPLDQGVMPSIEQFVSDLNTELEKYA